jgi:hypothetical protein
MRVILAPPEAGVFGTMARDVMGALYEKKLRRVPTVVLSVTLIRMFAPVPCGAVQETVVADVQLVVTQAVPENPIVGVASINAKFSPIKETEAPEVVGVLVGFAYVATGASNVKDDNCVPIRLATVRLSSTLEPYPAPIAHDRAVLEVQVDVAHWKVLICTETVWSECAKLRPLTVTLSPAVTPPFNGRIELKTGESYVKICDSVPRSWST